MSYSAREKKLTITSLCSTNIQTNTKKKTSSSFGVRDTEHSKGTAHLLDGHMGGKMEREHKEEEEINGVTAKTSKGDTQKEEDVPLRSGARREQRGQGQWVRSC